MSRTGIAGWPLRNASLDDLALLWSSNAGPIIELPKDLVDSLSIKRLARLLMSQSVPVALAGTTDFAAHGGMDWSRYQRYLDIQIAQARFLGIRVFRGFLQAETADELARALMYMQDYTARNPDIEFVLETHNGWETTASGFASLLRDTDYRIVVDFANIDVEETRDRILGEDLGSRIAYFHTRRLPESGDRSALAETERKARTAYPDHVFLWEPKSFGTKRALEIWHARSSGAA